MAALYVGEVAAWAPRRWRPAIAWIAILPQLPLAGRSGEGASLPLSASEHAALGVLAAGGTEAADPVARGLARLRDDGAAPPEFGRRWIRRWRALWPQGDSAGAGLGRLVSKTLCALAAAGGPLQAHWRGEFSHWLAHEAGLVAAYLAILAALRRI